MQRSLTDEWSLTELRSDNSIQGVAASTSTPNRDLSDLDMFMLNTSHAGNFNYWANTYNNIRNINLLLNSLNVNYVEASGTFTFDTLSIPVVDADRRKIAAEAQFLRAYHYFNLVQLYGGVFLIHEPTEPDEARNINRATVADIYKLIVADLRSAETNGLAVRFSASPTAADAANLGRANRWSAKALLAKVLLTQGNKTAAVTLLNDIIANSGYSLQSVYNNVFSIANEMNSEVLFAIRYKAGGLGLGSPLPNLFAALQSGATIVNGDGRGLNTPSTSIINGYFFVRATNAATVSGSTTVTLPVSTSNDSIAVGMYITGTQIPANATVTAKNGNNILTISAPATATANNAILTIGDIRRANSIAIFSGTRPYPLKLISNPAIANDAENDWMVIRYADVLLMLAEAQGNSPASIALINQIRTRARLIPIVATSISTTSQFETLLANERRWEFAFENQRYFDLMRYATTMPSIDPVQTLRNHFAAEYPFHYASYPAPALTAAEIQANVTQQKLLLPIPQREIDNNTRIIIPQNPGY
jgi:starch-binding outer membrane protein, SusD/RagB family